MRGRKKLSHLTFYRKKSCLINFIFHTPESMLSIIQIFDQLQITGDHAVCGGKNKWNAFNSWKPTYPLRGVINQVLNLISLVIEVLQQSLKKKTLQDIEKTQALSRSYQKATGITGCQAEWLCDSENVL